MAASTLIEVAHKPGITDPVGKGLAHDIVHLGLAKVKGVESAQLYRLEGPVTAAERERIVRDLLCDPILHESRESGAKTSKKTLPGLSIDVWFKPGVTDVVGDSVRKGIKDLNIQSVQSVRTGMRYHLQGVTRKEIADKIAAALLVNPLVHEATIHAD